MKFKHVEITYWNKIHLFTTSLVQFIKKTSQEVVIALQGIPVINIRIFCNKQSEFEKIQENYLFYFRIHLIFQCGGGDKVCKGIL